VITFDVEKIQRSALRREAEHKVIFLPLCDCIAGQLRRRAERAENLDQIHQIFRQWLGTLYDTDVLDAVLAAAIGRWMPGDPVWLLVIAGSGDAKTETLEPLAAVGATVVSTITSAGALLSGLAKKDWDDEATGGLLRQLGKEGLLVLKDMTSVLSLGADARRSVLSALRDVYDGHYVREVGGGGGRREEWNGRIVVVGAVTTAWDTTERDTTAKMGDRFVVIRMNASVERRAESGRSALAAGGHEDRMRIELALAVKLLFQEIDIASIQADGDVELTQAEQTTLLDVVDLITRARSGVEYDFRGQHVVYAHTPEAPTRLIKQLGQLFRGCVAIGLSRKAALALTLRAGRDTLPPIRRLLLTDLLVNGKSAPSQIAKRLQKGLTLISRELEALYELGLLGTAVDDVEWRQHQKVSYHLLHAFKTDAVKAFLRQGDVEDSTGESFLQK
jgi:hypothetical protein